MSRMAQTIIKMKNYLLFLVGLLALASCDPNLPFQPQPQYEFDKFLAEDRLKIDAFLDTARIDSISRIHDPSGIVIIVQEEGAGSRPVSSSVIYSDYTGYLISDGSVFDTSIEQVARENDIFDENRKYVPFSFVLGSTSVIAGWDIVLRRMRPGSKFVMIIPSPYAYRSQENNPRIPPNSVLAFEVDFLGTD